MNKIAIKLVILVACLLFEVNSAMAQHNLYINKNNRTHIINNVSQMDFKGDTARVLGDGVKCYFNKSDVTSMSFKEIDTWKKVVMPEKYLDDFNFDISFQKSDKDSVKSEVEITDENNKLYDDFLVHSTWSKIVNINFAGNMVTVEGDKDSIEVTTDGAHITIKTQATGLKYILSGESSNGSFKLYSEKKACLMLNGLTLTNPKGPAINSQLKKRLFIDLAEGTKNTLVDGSSYTKVAGEDQRGCIFAEGKICISGKGELYVEGNKKCAIASDDNVHILDGFVHVEAHAQKGKAVYAKDNIIIGGGVLQSFADGIASKGIASDSLVTITGGMIKSITTGDALWDDDEQDYSSCCALKSEYAMSITGGSIYCLSTGTGGKGISAGNEEIITSGTTTKTKYNGTLTINDANIYVRTAGERIPAVKQEDSHGNAIGPSASPKGMKSADKMTINSGNIFVRCSGGAAAEGIESKKSIDINGGKIRTYCVDDGMNAEGCNIKGGDILVCSTENDGFDVSYLFMYDGSLYTIGADVDQMGLDTDGKTFKVFGGEIVGVGARNCQPFASSTQANVLCYITSNVSFVALSDGDGNILKTIPTPPSYNVLCVLLSNKDIVVGNNYKILSYKNSLSDAPVTEYEFTATGISTKLGSFK